MNASRVWTRRARWIAAAWFGVVALCALLLEGWASQPALSETSAQDIIHTESGRVLRGTALATQDDISGLRGDLKREIDALRSEMRWLFGIVFLLLIAFLTGAGILLKILFDMKGQISEIAGRLQTAPPSAGEVSESLHKEREEDLEEQTA